MPDSENSSVRLMWAKTKHSAAAPPSIVKQGFNRQQPNIALPGYPARLGTKICSHLTALSSQDRRVQRALHQFSKLLTGRALDMELRLMRDKVGER